MRTLSVVDFIDCPYRLPTMAEKHYRSIVKAVSWQLTGSIDTMIISCLITGRIKWALSISGVELFT